MSKYYLKSALILKAIFCFLLAPIDLLIAGLLTVENNFMFVILSVLPVGCLYTVPFWLTLIELKKFRHNRVGPYILLDSGVCLVPAFFGALASDIFVTVANGRTNADGLTTIIFGVIFLLISLTFWLLYFVFSKRK